MEQFKEYLNKLQSESKCQISKWKEEGNKLQEQPKENQMISEQNFQKYKDQLIILEQQLKGNQIKQSYQFENQSNLEEEIQVLNETIDQLNTEGSSIFAEQAQKHPSKIQILETAISQNSNKIIPFEQNITSLNDQLSQENNQNQILKEQIEIEKQNATLLNFQVNGLQQNAFSKEDNFILKEQAQHQQIKYLQNQIDNYVFEINKKEDEFSGKLRELLLKNKINLQLKIF